MQHFYGGKYECLAELFNFGRWIWLLVVVFLRWVFFVLLVLKHEESSFYKFNLPGNLCFNAWKQLTSGLDWLCMEASKSLTDGSFGSTPGSCRPFPFELIKCKPGIWRHCFLYHWDVFTGLLNSYRCKNGRYERLVCQ